MTPLTFCKATSSLKVSLVKVVEREFDDLPEGDLLIRVNFSSLNYKDALSAKGDRGVTKKFPHTPGIDAVGGIESSTVQILRKVQVLLRQDMAWG